MNLHFEDSEGFEQGTDSGSFGWTLQEADDALEAILLDRFRSMSPEQKQSYLDYADILLKVGGTQLTRKQKVDILKAIDESSRTPRSEDLGQLVHDVVRRKKY